MDSEKVLYSSTDLSDFILHTKELFDIFKVKPVFVIKSDDDNDIYFEMTFNITNCYKNDNFKDVFTYSNQEYDMFLHMYGWSNDHVIIPSKCVALYVHSSYTKENKMYTYTLSIKPVAHIVFTESDKAMQNKIITNVDDIKSFIYYLKL